MPIVANCVWISSTVKSSTTRVNDIEMTAIVAAVEITTQTAGKNQQTIWFI